VSVNPFKDIPIYTEEYIQLYRGKQSFELPPHVFSIADDAYGSLSHGYAHLPLAPSVPYCLTLSLCVSPLCLPLSPF